MALQYSPKIVTDSLVMCLDPSQNKSYPTTDLPVKGGLALWLDASDDSTFSYSSGTSVSQWRDKSGNNFHATQALSANQPSRSTTQNSRKTVTFDGTNDTVTIPNFSCNSEMSIFVVSNCGTTLLIEHSTDTNSNQGFYFYGGGTGMIYITRATGSIISNSNWLSGGYSIASAVNSTGLDLLTYKNGSQQTIITDGRGSLTNTYITNTLYIGSRGANSLWSSGPIAEIIIYNRKVTDVERKQIHTYLGQKWGILNTDRSIIDLSGFNDNGLLGNGTTTAMPAFDYYNKGSLKFDGSNDYIDVGNPDSVNFGSGDFTIEMWITRNTNATTNLRALGKAADSDAAGSAGYAFFGSDGAMNFAVNPGAARTIISAASYSLGEWFHVVGVVQRGSTMRTYKNGVLVSSTTAPTGSVSNASVNLNIGRSAESVGLYWPGNIGIVRMYNKALSINEISQNYEAQKSRFINYIVTNGLALNLDAGNPYSYAGAGTTWYDVSGNTNSGTLTNGPTYNSDAGGNIVFDGSNDYVSIPSAASIKNTSNLSLEGWVFISSAMSYYGGIIGKGISDSQEEYCLLVNSANSKVYMDVGAGGGPYTDATYSFSLNTWYHIIGTHERVAGSSTIKIYVNGSLLSSTTVNPTSAVNDNTTNVSIGSRYDGGTSVWNGKIATARIYTRTLSAAEVLQNYNATKGRFAL